MAAFQSKTGCKRLRKREHKSYRSDLTRNRKFKKNSKKIQEIKKYHYGFNSSQNRMEKAEKERK